MKGRRRKRRKGRRKMSRGREEKEEDLSLILTALKQVTRHWNIWLTLLALQLPPNT